MITPDTIKNVCNPTLSGDWFFAQIGESVERWPMCQIVLTRTEAEFESSVLDKVRELNLGFDSAFGFRPCEITIVSFPEWLVAEAAERTDKYYKKILRDAVAERAKEYKQRFDKLPKGFRRTEPETKACLQVGTRNWYGEMWFVGTQEEFCTKFGKQFEWYRRGGSPSLAPQPTNGDLFGVFSRKNPNGDPISIVQKIDYNEDSDIDLISEVPMFYFQKKSDLPDLTKKLLDVLKTESELREARHRQGYAESGEQARRAHEEALLSFFGESQIPAEV